MSNRFRFPFLTSVVLFGFLLFANGCTELLTGKKPDWLFGGRKNNEPASDFKIETEDGKPKLIGDCATIGSYHAIRVHGFGLVVGLPGTGGEDANTFHYKRVYDDLNRSNATGIRSLLARPDTAVVEIQGTMHAGIQQGDKFDVQVLLPMETETKSLKGGYLTATKLTETAGGGTLTGTTRARAEGPIMVEDPMATETNNSIRLQKGTILGGATTIESRSLSLHTKNDARSIFVADRVAKAINYRFPLPASSRKGVATAESDELIIVDIHPDYANDIPRYVRVIQSIACFESQPQQLRRIERLKEELLSPSTAQQAAFQLEAIGKPGIQALQQALRSPNMEVRFHAATSLAYLGDGTSAKVLAEIAQQEPAFRVYALNALSVMKNELEAEFYLRELLHVPSAETRYGAFRALKNRNPSDQSIRGEMLRGQFSYHGITSPAAPMVHMTSKKYPEIVLFGTDIFLKQPFTLDAGARIYVNGQAQGKVVINRFVTSGVDETRTVSNRLDEVIRTVVAMGGTYPDVVQLLRQADMRKVLSCRLETDCLPESNREYRRQSDELEFAEEEEKPKSFWDRWNPKNIFLPNPGEKTSGDTGTVNSSGRD